MIEISSTDSGINRNNFKINRLFYLNCGTALSAHALFMSKMSTGTHDTAQQDLLTGMPMGPGRPGIPGLPCAPGIPGGPSEPGGPGEP